MLTKKGEVAALLSVTYYVQRSRRSVQKYRVRKVTTCDSFICLRSDFLKDVCSRLSLHNRHFAQQAINNSLRIASSHMVKTALTPVLRSRINAFIFALEVDMPSFQG